MAFTDRFVKLPIKIYSESQKELTGKATYEDNYTNVLPLEICSYRPQVDDENGVDECTHVSLKNGESFNVYMTIAEFEAYINKRVG